MNIIWLGHGSFRIEIDGEILLIDPWITGNPMMADQDKAAAIADASQILVTHGHFDHTQDIADISKKLGVPVTAPYELFKILTAQGAMEGHGINKGGTVQFGKVAVSMVPASHSSSVPEGTQSVYSGPEIGYIIRGEGHCIYLSGDTGPMADMDWIGDYYKPDIGILSAGGYFTMDMDLAAYCARRYFNFDTVIPCHYRTFPKLEQSADALAKGLPGVTVIEPQVMQPITI